MAKGDESSSSSSQKGIPIEQLPPQQLGQIKQRMDADIESTMQRAMLLKQAKIRFEASKKALDAVEGTEEKEVLVPLAESLYVKGRQGDTSKVLVDIGTGYYIEKSREDAGLFCTKKSEMLQRALVEVEQDVDQKKHISNQVAGVLGAKLQQQRANA